MGIALTIQHNLRDVHFFCSLSAEEVTDFLDRSGMNHGLNIANGRLNYGLD